MCKHCKDSIKNLQVKVVIEIPKPVGIVRVIDIVIGKPIVNAIVKVIGILDGLEILLENSNGNRIAK